MISDNPLSSGLKRRANTQEILPQKKRKTASVILGSSELGSSWVVPPERKRVKGRNFAREAFAIHVTQVGEDNLRKETEVRKKESREVRPSLLALQAQADTALLRRQLRTDIALLQKQVAFTSQVKLIQKSALRYCSSLVPRYQPPSQGYGDNYSSCFHDS
jgi:hypothetical protein